LKKEYDVALDLYSKAIEALPTEPAFYTNRMQHIFSQYLLGAAVYTAIEKFDDAIKDCDRALEINGGFVKAYFRKALALREKLDNLSAMESLKKAIELEPSNEEYKKLFDELKKEYEEDNSIAVDHPERQRFEKLLVWLKEGGSIFDKLKIRYYTADYRGVHAARDIKKGETILLIPKE
jgi:tetratricopeptide (TPR) repeat protein